MNVARRWSADLAALGPFFAAEMHLAGEPASPPWQSMGVLLEHDGVLEARVEAVRSALASPLGGEPDGIDVRVAASVAHLGLVARLIAPAVGAGACGLGRISLSLNDLWWQNRLGGPYPLSVAEAGADGSDGVEDITAAIADRYAMSPRVLWGNVGSAANSAAKLVAAARPEHADAARDAADRILGDRRVDGGVLRAGPRFRRRSCCLIYQVAGDRSAVCGDCVLR